MNAVVVNLYTNGGELQTTNGTMFEGYFHILSDGTIKSGPTPEQPNSFTLIPYGFMPLSEVGDLLSMYTEDSEDFEGEYATITIKTYKNDIDIIQQEALVEKNPPIITLQPDLLFRRNNAVDYEPGKELFIDEARNIQTLKGKKITLDFSYSSDDILENISFNWTDSYGRTVYTGSKLEVDTSIVNWSEETFICTVTDTYGSDVTNDITITVIDPLNYPIINTNILKNGSANQGTAEWETIGAYPEEVGKFLNVPEVSKHPYGISRTGIPQQDWFTAASYGSVFYHKFDYPLTLTPIITIPLVNQWYPKPAYVDYINNMSGSLLAEIKENYFRAGEFSPVTSKNLDHSGVTKTSYQIIDLTDYADLLDGKVFGLKGFKAILFGWLGTRADQGDTVTAKIDFLDENDNEIVISSYNEIHSLNLIDRIVNEYRNTGSNQLTVYDLGWAYIPPAGRPNGPAAAPSLSRVDIEQLAFHPGLLNDRNDAIELSKYQLTRTSIVQGTNAQQIDIINALGKTAIVGRNTPFITIPEKARKIRVSKIYNHEPGIYDLINDGDSVEQNNVTYVSEAMVCGLNVRLFPELINDNGQVVDLSINPESGFPMVYGMDMRSYPPSAAIPLGASTLYNDPDMYLYNIDLVRYMDQSAYTGLYQLFDAYHTDLPIGIDGNLNTVISVVDEDGNPNELDIAALGPNYKVKLNPIYHDIYKTIITPAADKLKAFTSYVRWAEGISNNLYTLDKTQNALNYNGYTFDAVLTGTATPGEPPLVVNKS